MGFTEELDSSGGGGLRLEGLGSKNDGVRGRDRELDGRWISVRGCLDVPPKRTRAVPDAEGVGGVGGSRSVVEQGDVQDDGDLRKYNRCRIEEKGGSNARLDGDRKLRWVDGPYRNREQREGSGHHH